MTGRPAHLEDEMRGDEAAESLFCTLSQGRGSRQRPRGDSKPHRLCSSERFTHICSLCGVEVPQLDQRVHLPHPHLCPWLGGPLPGPATGKAMPADVTCLSSTCSYAEGPSPSSPGAALTARLPGGSWDLSRGSGSTNEVCLWVGASPV